MVSAPVLHDLFSAQAWERQRQLTSAIPETQACRGCLGVALSLLDSCAVESTDSRLFTLDQNVRWHTLLDLPPFRWRSVQRNVKLARSGRTEFQFRMPVIGPREETFDLCCSPPSLKKKAKAKAPPEGIDDRISPQQFSIFEALDWAMTSWAVYRRESWQKLEEHYLASLGLLQQGNEPQYLVGKLRSRLARFSEVLPRPYLAFRKDRLSSVWRKIVGKNYGLPQPISTFRRAYLKDLTQGMPVRAPFAGRVARIQPGKSIPIVGSFDSIPTTDVVFTAAGNDQQSVVLNMFGNPSLTVSRHQAVAAGEILAFEAPMLSSRWHKLPAGLRWSEGLVEAFGREYSQAAVRFWFHRQAVELVDGYLHFPADLVAEAGPLSSPEAMAWDLGGSLDYFQDETDAFIFPPLFLREWFEFRPGVHRHIRIDVEPRDRRFSPSHNDLKAMGLLRGFVDREQPLLRELQEDREEFLARQEDRADQKRCLYAERQQARRPHSPRRYHESSQPVSGRS